jgi:hypothetical protein
MKIDVTTYTLSCPSSDVKMQVPKQAGKLDIWVPSCHSVGDLVELSKFCAGTLLVLTNVVTYVMREQYPSVALTLNMSTYVILMTFFVKISPQLFCPHVGILCQSCQRIHLLLLTTSCPPCMKQKSHWFCSPKMRVRFRNFKAN